MSTWESDDPGHSETDVIEQVERRIDHALAVNRKREILVIAVILALPMLGIALTIYAATIRYWPLLAPGGCLQLLVVVPLRNLIKLREDAMRLQVVPQLLRLAET